VERGLVWEGKRREIVEGERKVGLWWGVLGEENGWSVRKM